MQVRTRHTPAAAVARLILASAEPVNIEAGALMATSDGVVVETWSAADVRGSAVVSTCTAPQQGGWVDVAPSLPGETYAVDIDGQHGWCVTKACWLATPAVTYWDAQSGGLRDLFGGYDGFLSHASGQGPVVVACFGALDIVTLRPGEFVTIDAGYVVAYADTVRCRLRQAGEQTGAVLATGAGLVFDFAGPGQILAQTRSPRALLSWLQVLDSSGRR